MVGLWAIYSVSDVKLEDKNTLIVHFWYKGPKPKILKHFQMEVSLNYCSQNGGKLYRAPYYNRYLNIGPRINSNLGQSSDVRLGTWIGLRFASLHRGNPVVPGQRIPLLQGHLKR